MAVTHFLKKTPCWTAVFFCLLLITKTSIGHGLESAGTLQGREVSKESTAPQEKIKSVISGQPHRSASPNVKRKVVAGWYGPGHHKKLTASGQRFDMFKNTLAHKTLPLGTKVRLVTLDQKRSAVGVVNDRGPYIKGRDFDLSYSMAKQLGIVRKGVAKLYVVQLNESDILKETPYNLR